MDVLKFGGASVNGPDAIRNMAEILSGFNKTGPLVIVTSAMGKSTNALEKVVTAFMYQKEDPFILLANIKNEYLSTAKNLISEDEDLLAKINDLFVEAEWVLEDEVHDSYDYIYDQIVSIGELVSTRIIAAYLKRRGFPVVWLDARDFIFTNENYRAAEIKWEITESKIKKSVERKFSDRIWILTQGFIGGTMDNNTTTLGREGSDYSAAILAFCLNAERVIVWKDVEGIYTADPNQFKQTVRLDRLSYREAIEMTYFGAKVIHPKTIQPLKIKGIPLYVKSFENPDGNGTSISENGPLNYPPIIVVLKDQVLLHISSRDFSFIVEDHLSYLFTQFARFKINVHLMRNTAVSFTICIDANERRINGMISEISSQFSVQKDTELELFTIRHYNQGVIDEMKKDKVIFLEELNPETAQLVMRTIPALKVK